MCALVEGGNERTERDVRRAWVYCHFSIARRITYYYVWYYINSDDVDIVKKLSRSGPHPSVSLKYLRDEWNITRGKILTPREGWFQRVFVFSCLFDDSHEYNTFFFSSGLYVWTFVEFNFYNNASGQYCRFFSYSTPIWTILLLSDVCGAH